MRKITQSVVMHKTNESIVMGKINQSIVMDKINQSIVIGKINQSIVMGKINQSIYLAKWKSLYTGLLARGSLQWHISFFKCSLLCVKKKKLVYFYHIAEKFDVCGKVLDSPHINKVDEVFSH